MMTRFVSISFLVSGLYVIAMRLLFPLMPGDADGGSMLMNVLKLIFGILPDNPVKPFLEGNPLQIVFMALMVAAALLLAGSSAENLRLGIVQAQKVVMTCVMLACVLLPVYVFCSLVVQFWENGPEVFLLLWEPVAAVAGLALAGMAVYLVITCRKLKVKISVLLPKLLPDYIIGLTTASSSAAFATTMDINENKLGIDPAGKRRRHLLPLCSDHPDGHPAGGDCHWRNGHHLSGLSYNKLTHFHVTSGDSPSGRSAWPAEPGDSAEEISCCIWFQSPQGIAYHKKKHCRNSLSLLRYRSAGIGPINRSKKETRDSESTE